MALTIILLSAIAAILVAILINHAFLPDPFPTINRYRGDFLLRVAHAEYSNNAQKLVADGIARYNAPFRIITTLGSQVVLPARFADWVKNCKDLDHQALVKDEYFADYPGFEGNGAIHDPNRLLINVTKTKLAQSSQCLTFKNHISSILSEEWTTNRNWHTVPWSPTVVARYIGRMSSAVFAGPEMATNPEWQQLILTYTINLFNGVRALRTWPAFLRPFIHWFLPECITCRAQLRRARALLEPLLRKRREERDAALAEGREPEVYEDAIAWMEEAAVAAAAKKGGRNNGGGGKDTTNKFDPAAAQLGFAIAAMHTTTELLNQVLVDICRYQHQSQHQSRHKDQDQSQSQSQSQGEREGEEDLLQSLRTEIKSAVTENGGWTAAALFKMRLLDSVVKETQRLKPGSVVNLERKVVRDTKLPPSSSSSSSSDGGSSSPAVLLRKGEHVAVDASVMWSDGEVFEDPEKWDGWRFLRMRQASTEVDGSNSNSNSAAAQFASSSVEHFAFGLGRFICPGRFMVANEIKVAVAFILLNYDMKLAEGCEPRVWCYGFEMLADTGTRLDVRWRGEMVE